MRLVIIGAPGAGKGTQSVRICEHFKIPHLSTGDIFRKHIKNKTKIGKEVELLISQGKLVPDEITMKVVQDKLSEPECINGFLMDGFPRTAKQAKFLEETLNLKSWKIDFAINLIVDDELIIKRMSGRRICISCGASFHIESVPPKLEGICDRCNGELIQRPDDEEQTVVQRLEVYNTQTGPIKDFYRKNGVLLDINGKDGVEETTNEIFKNLGVLNASY